MAPTASEHRNPPVCDREDAPAVAGDPGAQGPGAGCEARREPADELSAVVRRFAEGHLQGTRGSHAWDHTLRVCRLGARIARLEGADLLVDEAVGVSRQLGVSPLLIGATIVSLGTTLPEAAVSVLAAVQGRPEIALGNAVGSIICDTGLIIGLATLWGPLPLDRRVVNRQGWVQFCAGLLLVAACIPFFPMRRVFLQGGMLPQFMGMLLDRKSVV